MSAVEISAVGPAAGGTASSRSGAENAGLGEVDPTADPQWCDRCGWIHQPREKPVRCLSCRRHWTPNFHAVCDSCESREVLIT